ncbi:MAG: SRPBCC family protein [Planctomycetes bacterium]|nr:SRPBCC family protein [Planctomycetota bacterium]
MRIRRLRSLLVAVLVTNVLSNLALWGLLGLGLFYYWELSGSQASDPIETAAGWTPDREGLPPGAGKETVDVSRLGVSPSEWEKLLAGGALRETGNGDGRARVHARFLVRARPEAVYGVLADATKLAGIYEDLDVVEVKKSLRGEKANYDVVWFEGSTGPYRLVYCLRRDYAAPRSIRWTLVPWPGTSTLLKACDGAWTFTAAGPEDLTLVDYTNEIEIPALPDFLLEELVDHNLPHALARIRAEVEATR